MDKNTPQFRRGMREEKKEHPYLPKKVLEGLVGDHIGLHPRSAYKK